MSIVIYWTLKQVQVRDAIAAMRAGWPTGSALSPFHSFTGSGCGALLAAPLGGPPGVVHMG